MGGLMGPGGRFEQQIEDVLGVPMPVMRNRDRSLGEVLAASLGYGDRDYLVTAGRRMSYAEHGAAVAALAAALRDKYGVGKGDRVGILAANVPEWLVAFWAAQTLGAVAVGYNAWWAPREIEYGIGHTRPTVVIADAKRAARIEGQGVPLLTMEEDLPRLIAEFAGADLPTTDVDEDDPALILYTSGTSGRPKGAVQSHRSLLAVIDYHRHSDALLAAFIGGDPNSTAPSDLRYLLTAPLFHTASLNNLALPRLATGGAVVIYEGAFDVDRMLQLVEKEKVTNWAAVPTLVGRLMEHDLTQYDLSSLTSFALASAPSSPEFQQRLREKLPFTRNALVDSYGLTESSTAISVATPPELAAFPGTLGRPIVGVQVEIRDPFGQVLADGEEGEICARSPYVMLGYWDNPAATAGAITADRWLRTGDYGVLEDGRLRMVGRRSDLILRGGENIYPIEVEQVLDEHPAVAECAVIGAPHEDLGEEVAAVVVLRPGMAATEEELREFAAERIAYFKVPSRWRITTDPLPRNATGKAIRNQITL
ncbi:class I adenylate-forming enzyme family protein [Tomitella biformata]|uniref:class I adenylate-forming enzyme family protein n=1 Tax=Tomitella biformata TaxID=630403 RepID=UPI0004653D97|nr:class I adenylate-forming enzyme family protein [Tomitella biformata]